MSEETLTMQQVDELREWCREQRLVTHVEGVANENGRTQYVVISSMDQQAKFGKIYRTGETVAYRYCVSSFS